MYLNDITLMTCFILCIAIMHYFKDKNFDEWPSTCYFKSNKKFDGFNFDCLVKNVKISSHQNLVLYSTYT